MTRTDTGEKLVYVVDDDTTTRNLLKRSLTREGYRVQDFADAIRALAATAENPPDAILLAMIFMILLVVISVALWAFTMDLCRRGTHLSK